MTFAITNSFSSGTKAESAKVNENFTDCADEFNGTTDTGTATWKSMYKLGTVTLANHGDSFDISGLTTTAYKYLKVMLYVKTNCTAGPRNHCVIRINNDSGASNHGYNRLQIYSSVTSTSDDTSNSINVFYANSYPLIMLMDLTISNVATDRKLINITGIADNAGTVTALSAGGSWANTTDTITRITIIPDTDVVYQAGSSMTIYGVK